MRLQELIIVFYIQLSRLKHIYLHISSQYQYVCICEQNVAAVDISPLN